MDALAFLTLASPITHRTSNFLGDEARKEFKELFGISPQVCSFVWAFLVGHYVMIAKPMYFLCALMFLRHYTTERLLSSTFHLDEKTIRKHIWAIIDALAQMAVDTVSPPPPPPSSSSSSPCRSCR